ncbi:MAG: hypothetical protein EA424_24830 [Planctomycetaceae bacterium]|nr:MAG: hypothetical protein EA424_24830 [Planctomycetaceae bacterium]
MAGGQIAAQQDRKDASQPAPKGGGGETSDDQQPEPRFRRLPPPLDRIACNIIDLEQTGHFRLLDVKIDRTRQFDDEALIWTVSVRRSLSSTHAQILLRRLADARFYRVEKDAQWRQQILVSRLYYPDWIDSGAANSERLHQDERFEVWIPLTVAEVAQLDREKTNTLIFSHADRRTVLPETTRRAKPVQP